MRLAKPTKPNCECSHGTEKSLSKPLGFCCCCFLAGQTKLDLAVAGFTSPSTNVPTIHASRPSALKLRGFLSFLKKLDLKWPAGVCPSDNVTVGTSLVANTCTLTGSPSQPSSGPKTPVGYWLPPHRLRPAAATRVLGTHAHCLNSSPLPSRSGRWLHVSVDAHLRACACVSVSRRRTWTVCRRFRQLGS